MFDAIFLFLAVCGCVGGFIASVTHLFRVSFIFLAIKLYVELCLISLFRKIKAKIKTTESSSLESAMEVSTTAV